MANNPNIVAWMQREVCINVDRDAIIGTSDWCETWTNNIGKLFRAAQREYGKCIGRMRRDLDNDPSAYTTVETGWVFRSTQRYTDTHERYMREVWVELKPVYAPGTDNDDAPRITNTRSAQRLLL